MSYISYIERLMGIRGKKRNRVVYRGNVKYRGYMIKRKNGMK